MSVSGVVSLLDERHDSLVEEIWEDLYRNFRLRLQPPIAHFSYHVAEAYDSGKLEQIVKSLTHEARPFRVRTSGLGLFTKPQTVIYVALVRDLELSRFQRWLCQEIQLTASGPLDFYRPARWVPHITLAQQGLDATNLGEIVGYLGCREFTWELEVDNIALIEPSRRGASVRFKMPLAGRVAVVDG
jgi:2'-5' RNA ligase